LKKSEGKRPLGRSRFTGRWEVNSKMGLKGIEFEDLRGYGLD
jgi:hypothetical protein